MKEFESVVTIQFTKITQFDEASQDYRNMMDDYKATKEAVENYYKECFADRDDVQVKVQLFVRDMEDDDGRKND